MYESKKICDNGVDYCKTLYAYACSYIVFASLSHVSPTLCGSSISANYYFMFTCTFQQKIKSTNLEKIVKSTR